MNDEVLLQNGNILLRSYPVHGGYGYWMKDILQIQEINKKLTELGNILEEEKCHAGRGKPSGAAKRADPAEDFAV